MGLKLVTKINKRENKIKEYKASGYTVYLMVNTIHAVGNFSKNLNVTTFMFLCLVF